MAKAQKIKPKYQIYANLMFIFVVSVIFYSLYVVYINKGLDQIITIKPEESNGGGFEKTVDKNFQPGDEKSNFPSKLKWGRDF